MQQEEPDKPSYSPERAPMAFNDADLLGLSMAELDEQCDLLFEQPPMPFTYDEENELNVALASQIDMLGITIPIVHLKDTLYLIGSTRTNIKLNKSGNLMVRVGGGFARFDDHVPSQHRAVQRQIVVAMIKSGKSLENVVADLIENKPRKA